MCGHWSIAFVVVSESEIVFIIICGGKWNVHYIGEIVLISPQVIFIIKILFLLLLLLLQFLVYTKMIR